MTAIVEPTGARKYRAWCDKCKDGVNASKKAAIVWARVHNELHHPKGPF